MQTANRLPVLMEDLFTDNRHNWEIIDSDYNTNYLEKGKYYIEMKGGWATYTVNIELDYTRDFVIEARMSFISGTENHGYGISWGEDQNSNLHLFHISSAGKFAVGYDYRNNYSRIKDWQVSEFINNGTGTNSLRIEKLSDTITYFINEKPVFETFFTRAFGIKTGFVVHNGMRVSIEMYRVSGYLSSELNDDIERDKEYATRMGMYFEDAKKSLARENGYQWHISNKYKIIMEFPENWIVKEDIDANISIICFSPLLNSFDDFQENINLFIRDLKQFNLNLDSFFETVIKEFKDTIPDLDIVETGAKRIDIYDTRFLIYNTVNQEVKVKNTTYCIFDEPFGTAFVIHCNSKSIEFERYKPIFDRILRNIKIFNYN